MRQDAASDDAPDLRNPARIGSGVSTVLGIAVALLLALLPGGAVNTSRLHSSLTATNVDQSFLAAANRIGEARASLSKARGPRARPDFSDTPVLLAAALALIIIAFGAASMRPPLARAKAPARWPSTTRARAPPRR